MLHFKGIHVIWPWFIHVFTFSNIIAITIFPFVIYKHRYIRSSPDVRIHESIHIMQQLECLLVGMLIYLIAGLLSGNWIFPLPALLLFGILYLIFYLINMIRFHKSDQAYEEIPFEKEAYLNSNRQVYLGLRRPFGWVKYMKKL